MQTQMVQFNPMDVFTYNSFVANAIEEYATEKSLAGHWHPDEALRLSREAYNKLLPQGLSTPDNYLMVVKDLETFEIVGSIWFNQQRQGAHSSIWIYDIVIFEEYRRRGFGVQTMALLEEESRKLGAGKIELHVFSHNPSAISLYTKCGYQTTSLNMQKIVTN